MFCSGNFHHTIIPFDWQISLEVCKRKICLVPYTFKMSPTILSTGSAQLARAQILFSEGLTTVQSLAG